MEFYDEYLPNGLNVIIVPMPHSASVTIFAVSRMGALDHPEAGIPHFLEHLLTEGTSSKPSPLDVHAAADSVGGDVNAQVSHNEIHLRIKVLPEFFAEAAWFVADAYCNALFSPEVIRREKKVVIEEIKREKNSPQENAEVRLFKMMYGNSYPGMHILGKKKTLHGVGRRTLRACHKKMLTTDATFLVIAGNITKERALDVVAGTPFATLRQARRRMQTRQVRRVTSRLTIDHHYCDLDQTYACVGFEAWPGSHHESVSMQILTKLLSGGMATRLDRRMRTELAMCYSINGDYLCLTQYGIIRGTAEINSARAMRGICELADVFLGLPREPIAHDELERAKRLLATAYLCESTEDMADHFVEKRLLGLPLCTPGEDIAALRSVTIEKVYQASKEIFHIENLHLAIDGPELPGGKQALERRLRALVK